MKKLNETLKRTMTVLAVMMLLAMNTVCVYAGGIVEEGAVQAQPLSIFAIIRTVCWVIIGLGLLIVAFFMWKTRK